MNLLSDIRTASLHLHATATCTAQFRNTYTCNVKCHVSHIMHCEDNRRNAGNTITSGSVTYNNREKNANKNNATYGKKVLRIFFLT